MKKTPPTAPAAKTKSNRAQELKELKVLLLQERKDTLDHLKNLEDQTSLDAEDLLGDSADLAAVEVNQVSLTKLGVRLRKKLNKIDQAFERIEDGTYGICELTGEEIPFERLKARPFTQYTVEAKEELERKEKRYADHGDDDDAVGDDDTPEEV